MVSSAVQQEEIKRNIEYRSTSSRQNDKNEKRV